MLNYDTSNSSGSNNSKNTENLEATSYQSDEEKTSTDQDIKVTSYQSDKEKTSIDQDEDIKVTSHNSDEENTSSEDENIDIPEPMDTESTDPYGKRKIESDIQTNDYKISFNIDIEKVQNTTSILTSKIRNVTINKNSAKILGYKTIHPNIYHRHKKKDKQYKLVKWKPGNKIFFGYNNKKIC
ncbi:hypothetical protein Gotur_030782 [Gossypium turneri]